MVWWSGESRLDSAQSVSSPAPSASSPVVASSTPPQARPALDLLVVCTGNICRSLVAEAFIRRSLADVGLDAVVHSAGLRGPGLRPNKNVVKLLRRRGFRIRGYRSTALTPQMLLDADLVLGMAVDHVDAVLAMVPHIQPRVFTLKELIRRSDAAGGPEPGEPLQDWLARMHVGRPTSVPPIHLLRDDIDDPMGQRSAAYEQMADVIEALSKCLADLLTRTNYPTSRTGYSAQANLLSTEIGPGIGSPVSVGVHSEQENAMAVENNSTEVKDVPAPSADELRGLADELRTARDAFSEAEVTLMDLAGRLVKVLGDASDPQALMPADAGRQLGDHVAAVMRTADAESSAMREEAERYAQDLRSEAEAESRAVREAADKYASEVRRKVEEDSATMRAEADQYAEGVRRQAQADADFLSEEADRYARSVRGVAETDAAELQAKVERESAATRRAAAEEADATRSKAETEAADLLSQARASYLELVAAESELRSRLEGAAGALASALKGPLPLPPSPLALTAADNEGLDEPGRDGSAGPDAALPTNAK